MTRPVSASVSQAGLHSRPPPVAICTPSFSGWARLIQHLLPPRVPSLISDNEQPHVLDYCISSSDVLLGKLLHHGFRPEPDNAALKAFLRWWDRRNEDSLRDGFTCVTAVHYAVKYWRIKRCYYIISRLTFDIIAQTRCHWEAVTIHAYFYCPFLEKEQQPSSTGELDAWACIVHKVDCCIKTHRLGKSDDQASQ